MIDINPEPLNLTNNEPFIQIKEYALLSETNETLCETWFTFIIKNGIDSDGNKFSNVENLHFLKKDIDSVDDWLIDQDQSIFDLDTISFISETTAKEMSQLTYNPTMRHKKFDGKLEKIKFNISNERDTDKIKMQKIRDKLSYGKINRYIDDEDVILSDTEQSYLKIKKTVPNKKNKFAQLKNAKKY